MADSGRIEKKKDRQTNQADMGQKRRSHRMNITALLIFLFLFIGCSLLQFANNRQNAQKSCGLMLDQMKELITEDEKELSAARGYAEGGIYYSGEYRGGLYCAWLGGLQGSR